MAEESNDLFGKMLKGGTIDNKAILKCTGFGKQWRKQLSFLQHSTSVNIDEIRERLKRAYG